MCCRHWWKQSTHLHWGGRQVESPNVLGEATLRSVPEVSANPVAAVERAITEQCPETWTKRWETEGVRGFLSFFCVFLIGGLIVVASSRARAIRSHLLATSSSYNRIVSKKVPELSWQALGHQNIQNQ